MSALNSNGLGTIYGDLDPAYDDCSNASHIVTSPVGVAHRQEHRRPAQRQEHHLGLVPGRLHAHRHQLAGYAVCGSTSKNIGGNTVTDYSPHHEPFQYYKSTANPKHLPPSSEAAIGHTDQANHQYDISNFYQTLTAGNMPAVSFLKAPDVPGRSRGLLRPA